MNRRKADGSCLEAMLRIGKGKPIRMGFTSILYEEDTTRAAQAPLEAPKYFQDLNLDQIVATITTGKEDYDLKPFFYDSLKTPEAIFYRHEIMRDLENSPLYACVIAFASSMRSMREALMQSEKLYYYFHKKRWFLRALEIYCAAVREFAEGLSGIAITSRGFLTFREYITEYAASERFTAVESETHVLRDALAAIRYCIFIHGDGFTVRDYDSEQDYSNEVTATFKKFQENAVKDYRVTFEPSVDINHIEAKVLEFVAHLHANTFARLDAFVTQNRDFADNALLAFDREIQFYIAYSDYMRAFKNVGLSFCYPLVSENGKVIHDKNGFDLALAGKLLVENMLVVCNDLDLHGKERILVISGPNQGGKTTFARMFGQLHHLASIGVPVPGESAQLALFDTIFTHFEREETIENLHGKLQDDLLRIHGILDRATPQSLIILNEIFTSTALQDAEFLSRAIIEKVLALDALCVCVTFLSELASLSEKTVSMVSTVAPDNPATRTYKVVRRAADGRSYAMSIAEKYRLTYDCVLDRIHA